MPEPDAAAGGVVDLEFAADGAKDVEERHHVGLPGASHVHVTAGGERCAAPTGGLQPVRQRGVVVAVEPLDAGDPERPVGQHADQRAHLLQHRDQVDDLRLDGRVAQFGDAVRAYRGEQDLLGGTDAGVRQFQLGAVQTVRRGQVQALGVLVDDRAELTQCLQVEVDGPAADVAAAEVRDEGVAEPVQQRATEQDRDPAGTGVHVDLVDAGALDLARVQDQLAGHPARADADAVQLEQAGDDLHVPYGRDVP